MFKIFEHIKRALTARYYAVEVDRFELWAKNQITILAVRLKQPEVKHKVIKFIHENNIELNAMNNHFEEGFRLLESILKDPKKSSQIKDIMRTINTSPSQRDTTQELLQQVIDGYRIKAS